MSHLLDALNSQQRQAVEAIEGPLLILAGAGSGKTRVITYRIAYLIEGCGVAPESILAVTFTNKAAHQMKSRVASLISRSLQTWPHISTFHSFCVRVLRRDIDRLGYTRDFSVYDEDDQQRVVKLCVEELGLSEQIASPRAALGRISYAKNHSLTAEDMYRQAVDVETEKLSSVFQRYEQKLRASNALDFDDLLLKAAELLDAAPSVRDHYNERFRFILVDEYQDTNRTQYRLIRQLTRAHSNLCVVGDEDQSIYRWRGADIENILSFEKDFPQTREIRLEQNYRSTQMILDAATAVVSRNFARKGKVLWTDKGSGERIRVVEAEDAEEEGLFVANETATALCENDAQTVGVLYRTNAQSRVFEEALRRLGVDYRLVGGVSFYERAEIKDALAYARLAGNRRDDSAFIRIINTPSRGIGDVKLDALRESARRRKLSLWETLELELTEKRMAPAALKAFEGFAQIVRALVEDRERLLMSEFFKSILERSRMLEALRAENDLEAQGRIENLQELITAAAEAEESGETLPQFLDHAALVSETDNYDERARVTLMTLHSAKGLEFSAVFLVGFEEGLFPHKLCTQDQASLEEERRLCYVGMTRARDRLIISWARSRRNFGREAFEGTRPSRFLREIPAELVEISSPGALDQKARTSWRNSVNSVEGVGEFLAARRARNRQAGFGRLKFEQPAPHRRRWKLGSTVRHPKYGLGTVLECDGDDEDAKLVVSFPGYGTKKLVERYASLEKV
ncbi:MAG: UvrD-helicase domain-containing protein [Terriglobia bacterium]|jgi:DNA helicase-2/ATP-dependent DNA helicase PcrA